MTTCAKTEETYGPKVLVDVDGEGNLSILNHINHKKTLAAFMGDANRKSLDAHITRLVYEIVERQYGDLSRTEPFHYILASELDDEVLNVARRVAAEKNKPFNADSTKKYLGAHWHSRTTSGPHSAWNYKRVHKITTRDGITYYVLTTAFLFEIHFYNRSIDIFDVLLPVVQDALPAIRAALPWLLPADDNDDVFDRTTIPETTGDEDTVSEGPEVPEDEVPPVPTAEIHVPPVPPADAGVAKDKVTEALGAAAHGLLVARDRLKADRALAKAQAVALAAAQTAEVIPITTAAEAPSSTPRALGQRIGSGGGRKKATAPRRGEPAKRAWQTPAPPTTFRITWPRATQMSATTSGATALR